MPSLPASGYAVCTRTKTGNSLYVGAMVSQLSGQTKSNGTFTMNILNVSLGGPSGKVTSDATMKASGGMVIEKVAIFPGNAYSNTDLADYVWPSAEKYQKFSYADASRIVTWTTPSTAGDDCIPAAAAQYTVFDITNATDTTTTYTDGTASSTTGANWHYFCYSSNAGSEYVAPGSVLRFVAGDYKKSLAAGYSPVTYGGIIVEEGATGYAFASASRYSVLGDPTGATETWFEFNENFTFGRSSGCHLPGTVNIDIASGKTFTIAGTTTKTATTAKTSSLSGPAGGTLKLHGVGKLAATLTASGATLDYTDLSATCSSSTDAYIQGTVTVNSSTVIALPSGATFPYFIATGISGALDSETGVTIGGVAALNYVAKADGSIIYSAPAEATISSDATWGSGALDGWTTDDATKNYIINVTGDATLTLDSAVSLNKLTLNVSENVTLTISGAYTITAADCIYVTGSGKVSTAAAATFSATMKGDGTVSYPSHILPAAGAVWTNAGWTGTVILNDCGADCTGTSGHGYVNLASYGNANSFIRAPGYKGYTATGLNCTATLVIADGETFTLTDGNGGTKPYFAKLKGAGTLAVAKMRSADTQYTFGDVSEFTGNVTFDSTATEKVVFGGVKDTAYTGKFVIAGSVAIAAGATWNMAAGITVNGTLTVPSTATLTGAISGSGTIVANQQFPVPGSSFTGTLTINGDAQNGTTTDATAIYGSTLNVASGQVGVTGNVTKLPDTINIASGAFFVVMNASLESLSLGVGTWDGTLAFIDCTSLASLTIDAGTKRAFPTTGNTGLTLPNTATLSTVNLVLDEVKGEGGTITLSNTAAISAIAGRTYNFTVNCLDGKKVSGTYDSATSTITYTPSISGAATDIDWDFTDGEDDALEQAPSGVSKNFDADYGDAMTFYTDANDSTKTGVYIKHHPYITGAASFMGNNSAAMTVAVVGTMPATSNTIFLNVGSAYANQYGLVFLTTATANEVLIGYNYGGTVTPITTMTVPNSSTARHSYIVTKQDGDSTTTFTVYLDGIKWKTVTTASKITFPSSNSGVQVGSDFGGNIYGAGTYSKASDDVGVLNVLRVYGRIITEAEIAVYASTFPYVSPNGASSRTFATAAEDWVEATDTDWMNTDSSGTTTQETAPSAGASVTVTAAEATEITVNLASDTQYEALTINGSATTLAAGSGSGKISVTGMTVIGAPVTVEYGAADFTGGPMTITEDGTITFDYSSYDISGIYTTTDIPLTSDVDQDNTKVTLTPPTATYQTATLVYTSGQYVMRVTPEHEAGINLYYVSGYWSNAANNTIKVVDSDGNTPAVIFPGDIVVIDSTHPTVVQAWVADTFPANVTNVRIARDFTFHSGVSAAIFGGVTVSVDEGVTLTLNNSGSQQSITLGAVTLNGPGSVAITDTIAVSGAVSGTATLTISGTVNVAAGGSIANAVAGSGTITYAAIPAATPSSFTGWTGTVSLPSFNASSGINFNRYGTTGSTVALVGMTSGYILEAGKTVAPTLRLDGAMNITAMSTWTYIFAEITGTGNLSFPTSENSPTVTITKVAEGYSGTITSTLATPVAITTLARASGTSTAAGAKLLDTGNATSVTVGAVTVGGDAAELDLVYKAGGVYVSELQGAGYWVGTTAVITNSEETVTVPSGATALRIYPSANDTSLVLTAEQAQTLVLYSSYEIGETSYSQDITSAFTASTPVQVDGGQKITLSLSATDVDSPTTVTVDEETISVAPALAAAAPMTLDANAKPTFAVKTIPGLWYRVEAGTEMDGTSLGGTGMAGASVQATSTSTALAAPEFPEDGNVLFYKIAVGISRDDIEPAAEP